MPTKTYRMGGTIFSVWFHVTDPTQMALVHSGVLVVMLLFTVGFCTRVTSVLVWLAGGLHPPHAAGAVRDGHDDEHPALLPDDREQRRGAVAGPADRPVPGGAGRACGGPGPSTRRRGRSSAPAAVDEAGFAMRLIQVHFCFIYAGRGAVQAQGRRRGGTGTRSGT